MEFTEEKSLTHYGMPRRSGRYPWGSGENPYQHGSDFLSRIAELKSQGLSETEIAKSLNLSTTEYRAMKSLANDERRALDVARVKSLQADGLRTTEIAKIMGKNESSIRSLLNEESEARMNKAKGAAEFLKSQLETKGMIDVGAGVEKELNISQEKMKEALTMLQMQGYEVYSRRIPQVTNPGKWTTVQVLCPPGTEYKDVYSNMDKIQSLRDYISYDGGDTFKKAFVYPESMDSKRLQICYDKDGGSLKDGLIEIRRGVDDLSLGDAHYAQVRILVDGDRYLKGMAVYSDDLPDGIDVRFNTNKSEGTPMRDVLKKISSDPDNPFGSLIKEHGGQSYYIDKDGNEKLSLINKRAEEGDWGEWADRLSAQFLAKQPKALINKQLNLAAADKQEEFDKIRSLTNPTVKKALLQSFADDCDSAAEHLYAAALPRQKYQVILPLSTIKDNEVYAPNYRDGETVALVRYPHGGTFEIPILKVNNKLSEGKKVMTSTPMDAIGISAKVAQRLSGADFDGDTVMVIPCNSSKSKVRITSTPELEELKDFDPKSKYGGKKEGTFRVMRNTQNEMGKISNLITDMTIKGARMDEIAKAVRHSMVVIDAEKHKLDYKQSEIDNNISALKKKYQGTIEADGKYHEGTSTLISRAKSQTTVLKRQGSPQINQKGKSWYDPNRPEGALIWKSVREEYVDKKTGKTKVREQKVSKMSMTDDANTLVSSLRTPQEKAYATYANRMKAMANQARKEMVTTGNLKYSPSAKAAYKKEVDHLNACLNIALKNAPRERRAQALANAVVNAKKADNPDMTKSEIKKASQQALTAARASVGAKRETIKISDREWEAIQAGAISENQLTKIIRYADMDELRKRATPRNTKSVGTAQISRMKALRTSGYTTAEIAEALGLSSSTISKYLNGKE